MAIKWRLRAGRLAAGAYIGDLRAKIVRADRPQMDPARVEEIFDEVERLIVVGRPQALADLVQAAAGLTTDSALPES